MGSDGPMKETTLLLALSEKVTCDAKSGAETSTEADFLEGLPGLVKRTALSLSKTSSRLLSALGSFQSRPKKCAGAGHCGFHLSLMSGDVEHLFMCSLALHVF